jgi:uncharacterized membrane protein
MSKDPTDPTDPTSPPPSPQAAAPQGEAKLHAVELLLSRVLGAGVYASLALCAAGAVLHLVQINRAGIDERSHTLGWKVIFAGLVLLIATPIVRVLASLAAFATQRDWVYAGISLFVLLLLAVSMLLGAVH